MKKLIDKQIHSSKDKKQEVASMELLIMNLRSQVEGVYLSKEFKEKIIQDGVKTILEKDLKENKISSTEYQIALDILKRYNITISQVDF